MKRSVLLMLLLILVQSCNPKDNSTETNIEEDSVDVDVNIGASRLDSILVFQERVLENGDKYAYEELRIIALDLPPDDFFFWAFTMANKYDYSPAYTDVFKYLLEANRCDLLSIDSLDTRTKELALEYLKKGSIRGDEEAKEILAEME